MCYYNPNRQLWGLTKAAPYASILNRPTGEENDYHGVNNYGYYSNGDSGYGTYGYTQFGGNHSAYLLSFNQRTGSCQGVRGYSAHLQIPEHRYRTATSYLRRYNNSTDNPDTLLKEEGSYYKEHYIRYSMRQGHSHE